MKTFFRNLKEKFDKAGRKADAALRSCTGEGYIDTAVKIIIGVVIGSVILTGLYALFNTTVIPTLTEKVGGLFSYSGT